MLVFDNYRIKRLDDLNIVVENYVVKEKGKNAGKYFWKIKSYHGNYQSALNSLLKRVIDDGCDKDVIERVDAFAFILSDITAQFKEAVRDYGELKTVVYKEKKENK